MKIWKHTWLDGILFFLSIFQFLFMITMAFHWQFFSFYEKLGIFVILVFMITYNIIIISHLFTHTAWFQSPILNSFVSMLNTINICQSVQAYHLKHVCNHHRYNNDQKDLYGKTRDLSSTFQKGIADQHATLFQYAFLGSILSLLGTWRELLSSPRKLWCVGIHENEILSLLSNFSNKRKNQLHQLRLDRMAHFFGLSLFILISWKWTVLCYFPSFYLALLLVNIQNYYEHYGANPINRIANSVSYYGRIYNFLTFNDGYHQEHHLRCGTHWLLMPEVHKQYENKFKFNKRIISSVPAILGFLDRKRQLLHLSSEFYKDTIQK